MSNTPGFKNNTLKLLNDHLAGTEHNSRELTKMLLDLGITPPPSTDEFSPSSEYCQDATNGQSPEKSIKFESPFHPTPGSIFKKSTIKPLQLNLNTLNKDGSSKNNDRKSVESISKLVSRLCKTESVVQSLKLNMCTLKASHEASDRDKNSLIKKLKETVNEQESNIKKLETAIEDERIKSSDHIKRYDEAEQKVKELHNELQHQSNIAHEHNQNEDLFREKFSRKLEEAKLETAREKEVRIAIEDSHRALLSRVEDMEAAIEQERKLHQGLRDENVKIKELNENLKLETSNFHSKAEDLAQRLSTLTEELHSKEKAIRRLIEEQNHFQISSSTMVNEQANLSKELNQCNIALEVQKAAFSQLEAENVKLKSELEEAKLLSQERDEEETRKREEEEIRKKEVRLNKQQFEERTKAEMNSAIKNERKKYRELEERNKLLEECIKEQEKIIKIKEQEHHEREKESDEKLFEEKKKTARCLKESDQAVKAKENVIKELNRASSDVLRDKEFMQQQLEELKLERDALVKERDHQEEENQRLLNRIASVEQQEQAYKRAQELAQTSSNAKNQLAYENGKLQTRVEQLEDELRQMATVQSQLVQLRAANRAFEQKYNHVTSELATVKVDLQRTSVHSKQLQSGLQRKEEDFGLAISARDEALKEKESVLLQMEAFKEQEKNKLGLLKRDLNDSRADNDRLTSNINDITLRHSQLQDSFSNLQVELGRKDSQISVFQEEKKKQESKIFDLEEFVAKLQAALDQRDIDEQSRITPALETLERAKEENIRLSTSLERILQENDSLKEELEKNKLDLDIQRQKVTLLMQQQEDNEKDVMASSQAHSDRLQQMKDQFSKERAAIRKQLQQQILEMKKTNESTQARNAQLIKGNTDLRSRLAECEQTIEKLKEKTKQQKSALDRYHRDKRSHFDTAQKIKAIDNELKDLELTKESYIEKNKQQQEVISTFNTEVNSLRNDITALSQAHLVARERNRQLEAQIEKERGEKEVLKDKNKMMEEAMKQAIEDRKDAEEKLRRIEMESVHVQENLQEAQAWFKGKFESLQCELSKRKNK